MKSSELADVIQLSEDTPIVVTTDDGELLLVTRDGCGGAQLSADGGAEIVVVETDDGQQQIQLVTEDGGRVITLPPELANRLRENLSGLTVDGEGGVLQQLQLQLGGDEDDEGDAEQQMGEDDCGDEVEVHLTDGDGDESETGAVELPEGTVTLAEGTVELSDGVVALTGDVELPEGTVTLGGVELHTENEELEQTEGDEPSHGAGSGLDTIAEEEEDGNAEETEEDVVSGSGQMGDFMKVEEQQTASGDENIEEEFVGEEIGEILGDLGFPGAMDALKAQARSEQGAGDATGGTDSQWTESTVTSASGAQLTIRLPALGEVSGPDPTQPTIRVFRPATAATGAPVRPPLSVRRERTRAEEEAWAARTRRRASRGIARAVAAVRRAEDSDSFDSESSDEEPPPPPVGNQPKRGRGRPRKPGGFSCQLCSRRLETQAAFFQHLRDHYEKPGGKAALVAPGEANLVAPGVTSIGDKRLRLEPICEPDAELGGAGDGPAVLNVDIIAAEEETDELYQCDDCEVAFYTEDELERHRKTHIIEHTMPATKQEPNVSEPEPETEEGEVGPEEGEMGPEEGEMGAEDDESGTDDTTQSMKGEAHSGGEYEPPAAADPIAVDQYELKNLKKCDSCHRLFTTVSSLEGHRARMHNTTGAPVSVATISKHEYECEDCHVTYTSHKIYERHRQLHRDKAAGRLPHRCTTCSASFLTSMLLAHHLQKEHPERCSGRPRRPGGQPPRPNGRPPGSSNRLRQAVYEQIQELENGWFGCKLCGKEIMSKSKMFYHVSIKHKALDGHRCATCEKRFFTEAALRVHERTHTGERPFGCDFCPRRFRQQADLNAHVMSVHTQERPFHCRFCQKSFSRKYSLTIHMRCHTNERNYKCTICNKGFRASTYLNGHMKIHTGEKSHACPICFKSFRMRSDMKRHIFTHSRDRPHPRSLRALNVQLGGEDDNGVMLLDPSQLCLQLVSGEDGDTMVITEGNQAMVLDGAQTVIDEQTGQLMVPESAISELDETAMASMYLMADSGQTDAMQLS